MLWTLLLACPGPKDTDDTAEETGQVDTDTGDTAPPIDPDLSFDMSGAWEGGTLALIQLDMTGQEGPVVGDHWQSWLPDDATFGVEAGAPPAEHMVVVDPENNPDWSVAIYIVALFDDADSNGQHDEGEVILGVSPQWAIYSDEDLPAGEFIPGLVAGWNGYVPDFGGEGEEGGPGDASDPLAIPMPANLSPRQTVTFGGANTMDTDVALRVAAIPGVTFDGGTVDSYLYDEDLGAEWSVTFTGAPPEDHFQELEGIGLGAFEAILAYVDGDASGSFGPGDSPVATACKDGKGALILWIPELVSMDAAWTFGAFGFSTGWAVMLNNGEGQGPVVLDEADFGSLVIDEECNLGD